MPKHLGDSTIYLRCSTLYKKLGLQLYESAAFPLYPQNIVIFVALNNLEKYLYSTQITEIHLTLLAGDHLSKHLCWVKLS